MKALYSILEKYIQVNSFAAKRGFLLMLAIFFCSTLVLAQNPNVPTHGWGSSKHAYQEGEASGVPAGYPKFMDNGNPSEDIADFQQRKEAWIKANPERYKQMLNDSKATVVKQIPQAEFDRMPQDKKDFILGKPQEYKVVGNSSDKQ